MKTLHHYDRLGLLKPQRTDAGYRVYTAGDLERLEQIVALKFLGLSLQQIKAVLDMVAVKLPDALRLQRRVLEEKQRHLARGIVAIVEAEKAIRADEPTDPAVLRRLIEVIDMQEKSDWVRQYWSGEMWEKMESELEKFRRGPSGEWKQLRQEIAAAVENGEDPAGEKAQALITRQRELWKRDAGPLGIGDPEFLAGCKRAAADREQWPVGWSPFSTRRSFARLCRSC